MLSTSRKKKSKITTVVALILVDEIFDQVEKVHRGTSASDIGRAMVQEGCLFVCKSQKLVQDEQEGLAHGKHMIEWEHCLEARSREALAADYFLHRPSSIGMLTVDWMKVQSWMTSEFLVHSYICTRINKVSRGDTSYCYGKQQATVGLIRDRWVLHNLWCARGGKLLVSKSGGSQRRLMQDSLTATLPSIERIFAFVFWPEEVNFDIGRYVSTHLGCELGEIEVMRQSSLFQPPLTPTGLWEYIVSQVGVRTCDGWGSIVVVDCSENYAVAEASPRAYTVQFQHKVKVHGIGLDTRRTNGQMGLFASRKEHSHYGIVRKCEETWCVYLETLLTRTSKRPGEGGFVTPL